MTLMTTLHRKTRGLKFQPSSRTIVLSEKCDLLEVVMSMLSAFALHCPCKRKNGTPKENLITPKENFDTPKENSITPKVMALSLVNSHTST